MAVMKDMVYSLGSMVGSTRECGATAVRKDQVFKSGQMEMYLMATM